MPKRIAILSLFIIALSIAGYYFISYLSFLEPEIKQGEVTILDEQIFDTLQEQVTESVDFTIDEVSQNLFVPWSVTFTENDRLLLTERNGNLLAIENNKKKTLHRFDEVSSQAEEGLMGLALDPNYQTNKFVYACLAYLKEDVLVDKVIRFKDAQTQITDIEVIIDDIPAARFHAGCELKFGPDEKLYITTGDATQKELAQDLDSLAGKILRLNSDGSIPEDNPFQDSPIFAYGLRNSQGIDWHPVTQTLFATDHGPSVFDGPAGGDEVNIIEAGKNYGWPLVSHEKNQPGLIAPALVFTPAIAPGSGMFYSGNLFPQFKNNFFFALLKGEGIMRVVVSDMNPKQIIYFEKLDIPNVGRIREITQGPEGYIYFTTSNTDGRGVLQDNDDKLYRLIPQN